MGMFDLIESRRRLVARGPVQNARPTMTAPPPDGYTPFMLATPQEGGMPMSLADNLIDPTLIPACGGPPHELFDTWRESDPVHWNPPSESYRTPMAHASLDKGFWVLTRYQDVVDVSRDQELFSSHEGSPVIWDFEPPQLEEQRAGLMGMKPADHMAVKKLVMPPFAAGELAAFHPEIDRVARSIIDSVAGKGECEFVFDVASRLPVYTFCKLLGVPDRLRETVFTLGNRTADTENAAYRDGSNSAFYGLFAIARELAAEKREHPDQYALLRSDLDRHLPNAIEEVLRHSPPVVKFRRTVMEDTEIGGQKVARGDKIYLSYPAANRDPAVFPNPHRFDITRENANRHLAFGNGPHFCLGSRLARYQLGALLKEIVTRIPDIRPDGEMEMMKSIWFNAVIRMPVAFTPEG